ncbi:unnamed protein product [Adineta steineri]|uniref:Uncharacterized protein n=1 Tax=Adineta steineri TaxID=433720 RepID=A0A814AUY7_9BILA|nr:unnamed protein product [Adineta steineri]CAF0982626.1 unnamed protein product [Adineta steineri]
MNDQRTYRAAVEISLPKVTELPPPPPYTAVTTELPPPPYTDVTTKIPTSDLVTVGHQQVSVDYNKGLCYILRDLRDRLTNHKSSMIISLIFFLLSTIWFAALIIGGENRWKCPAKPELAQWFIVIGVMGIVLTWLIAFLVRIFTNFIYTVSEK